MSSQPSKTETDLPLLAIGNEPTDETKTILEMFRAKKTMSEIGNVLGKTKGAIAGIISRARDKGFLPDMPPEKRRAHERAGRPIKNLEPSEGGPRKHRKSAMPLMVKRLLSKATTMALEEKPKRIRLKLIDSPTAVTFAELEPHHCRFPQGDPKRPDFRFCGCRRQLGSPYCEEHTVLTVAQPLRRIR